MECWVDSTLPVSVKFDTLSYTVAPQSGVISAKFDGCTFRKDTFREDTFRKDTLTKFTTMWLCCTSTAVQQFNTVFYVNQLYHWYCHIPKDSWRQLKKRTQINHVNDLMTIRIHQLSWAVPKKSEKVENKVTRRNSKIFCAAREEGAEKKGY